MTMSDSLTLGPIERVELYLVRLPLVAPFTTSFGTQSEREALLVKIEDPGNEGWGECVAFATPDYGYETHTTARHILRDHLLPMLGAAVARSGTLADLLNEFHKVRGHPMAKAAVENALLDLIARRRGQRLFQLLGGEEKRIPSGISLGIQADPRKTLDAVGRAWQTGYHRIKIKIRKGHDIDVMRRVRSAFPDIPLMVDANADYGIADLPLLKRLDEFDLMMIEQPLQPGDLYFHSRLQRELRTPICLDESIKTLLDVRAAAALESCRIINIKQGRVGGMLAAAAIEAFCRSGPIRIWSGGMLETGIGRAFNLHLQTLPGFDLPGDNSETRRYFNEDIVSPPVVLDRDGFITLPPGPGTGVRVDTDRLQRTTIQREEVTWER